MALLWAVILGGVGFGAVKAPAASDNGTSFMPGVKAQKAFDLIGERFPGASANDAHARIVFVAQHGAKVTAADNRAAIDASSPSPSPSTPSPPAYAKWSPWPPTASPTPRSPTSWW